MTEDNGIQYRYESVTVIRGREASAIAKKQNEGWELHERDQGRVRTTLTFRRAKRPIPRGLIGVGAAAAVVVIAVIGAVLALTSGTESSKDESTQSESSYSEGTDPSAKQSDEGTTSDTPSETEPTDEVLTVANNADLRALLTSSQNDNLSRRFSVEYDGRQIEFDGNVATANPHDGFETRFDFLIYAGDFSTTEANPGPAFQFRDVNFFDLNLQGRGSQVGTGDNLTIVAEVGEFERSSSLFLLDPVSTRLR